MQMVQITLLSSRGESPDTPPSDLYPWALPQPLCPLDLSRSSASASDSDVRDALDVDDGRPEHQLEHEDPGARDADHELGSLGLPAWDGAEGAQHHQQPPSHHARHAELDLGGAADENEGHDDNRDAGTNDDGAAVWTERVRFLLSEMLRQITHGAALHLEDFQKSFLEVFKTSLNRSFAASIGFLSVKHMLEKSCSDICQVRRRRMDDKCCQWDLYPQSNKCASSLIKPLGPMQPSPPPSHLGHNAAGFSLHASDVGDALLL